MMYPMWIWPRDWFWREIDTAITSAKADLPEVSDDNLRELVLRGWLVLSHPAGSA